MGKVNLFYHRHWDHWGLSGVRLIKSSRLADCLRDDQDREFWVPKSLVQNKGQGGTMNWMVWKGWEPAFVIKEPVRPDNTGGNRSFPSDKTYLKLLSLIGE